MDTLAPAQTKKTISFWSVLIMYIYHLISAGLVVFIPYGLVMGISTILKYAGQATIPVEEVLYNPLVVNLKVLLTLIVFIIVIFTVFHDLGKNYQINKANYKEALNVFLIIYGLNLITAFNVINLVLYVFLAVFLFWLADKKFAKGEKILENKFLNIKNTIFIMLGVAILSSIVFYFI